MAEPWVVCALALAGGLGATARYTVDRLFAATGQHAVSWSLLTINVTGSFAAGLIAGTWDNSTAGLIAATGFLGGYTTFSTASLEFFRAVDERRYLDGLLIGPGMLLVCVMAAWLGFTVT